MFLLYANSAPIIPLIGSTHFATKPSTRDEEEQEEQVEEESDEDSSGNEGGYNVSQDFEEQELEMSLEADLKEAHMLVRNAFMLCPFHKESNTFTFQRY